ncbi:MAG TPA: aminoacyl-tRNA hydrolase [Acidimicrobiales bacterium]
MAFGSRGDRPRRGTPADWLVVGLGNPGKEYAGSRHNVGFEVVDLLARRHEGRLKAGKERALVGEVRVDGQRIALAQPTTFMNLSGESVTQLVRRFGVDDPERLVVAQDELDLPVGTVRVKLGGGLAGHNGLRSIKAHLHTDAFVRVRIGIGKPPTKEQGADHVLKKVSKSDRELLAVAVEVAADAVETIVAEGVEAAMNQVNSRST